MAFDGITISSIVNELNNTINGGRLYKISQPEADEIMLTIKTHPSATAFHVLFSLLYTKSTDLSSPFLVMV